MEEKNNELRSYKSNNKGLLHLTDPVSMGIFHIFEQDDIDTWFLLQQDIINNQIECARAQGQKQLHYKIGGASYKCKNLKDLMNVQQKLIQLYKDSGYAVILDTTNVVLHSFPRSADIIIKISR